MIIELLNLSKEEYKHKIDLKSKRLLEGIAVSHLGVGVATFDWREKEGRFNLKIKFEKDGKAHV